MNYKLLLIPTATIAVATISIPMFQDAESLKSITAVLTEWPPFAVMAWITYWLQNRHQDTIQKIMTGIVERENRKDENQKEIVEALLRVLDKSPK